jgi:hypothetical protein
MDARVDKICEDIDYYIRYFNKSDNFVGPSIYFHHKTIERMKNHNGLDSLLDDDLFFDYLYATLTSWGLHRMGPHNTKLIDIDEFKNSVRKQKNSLTTLWGISIYDLSIDDAPNMARTLWKLFSAIQVSIAEAKIVSCSKALHHILPNLMPPIDRQYTYRFFYNRNSLSISEEDALEEMYLRLYVIAFANRKKIDNWIGNVFNTSETKVLDNAIVGFVMDEL